MIREILTYPNPILRKKSQDIVKFDKKLHSLLDDMNDTMMAKGGVGLAAVQIGELKRVLIINIPVKDENDPEGKKEIQLPQNLIEAINPVITKKEGEIIFQEGCLSVPGYYDEIKRAKSITVEFFDRFGNKKVLEANDFLAVAFQHEIEHLQGHLFIENLSFLKRKKFEKEWKKKKKSKK